MRVIRRLTLALNTNADQLTCDPDERTTIRTVIDGILIRHQARKLASYESFKRSSLTRRNGGLPVNARAT